VDDGSQIPRVVSVTTIRFRRWWHVDQASRRWRRLYHELLAAGYQLESRYAASRRERRITFLTTARTEDELRRAAATHAHVSLVRWTIVRRQDLWSAVYVLSGWSSMSGPPQGVWSTRAAIRELSATAANPRPASGDDDTEATLWTADS
jgi:hypothetical protein